MQPFSIIYPDLDNKGIALALSSCLQEEVVAARTLYFRQVEVFAWRKNASTLYVHAEAGSIMRNCTVLVEIPTNAQSTMTMCPYESRYGDL